MIGRRPLTTGLVAALVLVPAMGAGWPPPEISVGANRLVTERAAAADATLVALRERLTSALDPARSGAANVVAGDDLPSTDLSAAAQIVGEAVDAAIEARRNVTRLQSAMLARSPSAARLPPAPDPATLSSIAGQLDASAAAGDAFLRTRQRAQSVAEELQDALAALDHGDLLGAREAVAAARADHDAVAESGIGAVTLPVWLGTTDAMIDAVERIVEATERGDAAAAEAAADDFAALADDGVTADRALRIAIGEGGSAVTATPLGRLADVLRQIDALRVAIGRVS